MFNLIIGEGDRDLGKTIKHQLVIIGWIQANFSKFTKYKEKKKKTDVTYENHSNKLSSFYCRLFLEMQ